MYLEDLFALEPTRIKKMGNHYQMALRCDIGDIKEIIAVKGGVQIDPQ